MNADYRSNPHHVSSSPGGGTSELKPGLEALSKQRFCPPGSKTTRTYSVATLQRWYYAYKNEGLEGLKPKRRKDAFMRP